MVNEPPPRLLSRLLGKTVCFQGKYAWGEQQRLRAMAEAQQGLIARDLDPSVSYLVLPDLSAAKTLQKKVVSLNAKGASIQIIDAAGFQQLLQPAADEVLALLRLGAGRAGGLGKVLGDSFQGAFQQPPRYTFVGEKFDGLDLTGLDLRTIAFDQCSFVDAKLDSVRFGQASQCDFNKASARSATFAHINGSRFTGARLNRAEFTGSIANVDFSSTQMGYATFTRCLSHPYIVTAEGTSGVNFTKAVLKYATFTDVSLTSPRFEGADLSNASFSQCSMDGGLFREVKAENTTFIGCKLTNIDFSKTDLRGANLADADLTGARFDGADLAGCNLRGATIANVDFANARNHDAATSAPASAAIGPSLLELDNAVANAKRITFSFRVEKSDSSGDTLVTADSAALKWGWAITLPSMRRLKPLSGPQTMSGALLEAAHILGSRKLRFETVEVSTTKSAIKGTELRTLVINALSEAFGQSPPDDAKLAELTKGYREEVRERKSADRDRREERKKQVEREKAEAQQQVATKIATQVGKVTDIASFLRALELRCDKQKIDKATKMLKAARFQLYNDVTAEHLAGVVKSQRDPDLVYACRLNGDGTYACCTQNLNICGGLRGSVCKHLLVLIIGLVKAGELDPTTIDGWMANAQAAKPELDKEKMGEIFIRYKGAEAGEVDWRPTETVPEDYYAL
jgi:uncharacterized protein YjbI with pentapeptide repeats